MSKIGTSKSAARKKSETYPENRGITGQILTSHNLTKPYIYFETSVRKYLFPCLDHKTAKAYERFHGRDFNLLGKSTVTAYHKTVNY